MRYNTLGNTGVLVSELCLGAMTFGGRGYWANIGKLPQDEVTSLVKTAIDSGINFIDTANVYSEGLSEILLGKALKDLDVNRQDVFIATKVRGRMGEGVNQVGLSRLHIQYSVEYSLQRLGLDHIDLLYIHGVDHLTSLEETMRGLEEVVKSGKVRYLGISNHPAWMVVKANAIAEKMGWNKFVALQNYYSIAGRDIEREIVPMALSENLSIMPWSPLAGGFLSGKFTRNTPKAGITSIIIGAKKEEQLRENIAATTLLLTADEMSRLDSISEPGKEYPGWMVERQIEGRLPNV